jgi:hypothetical protein
MLAGPTRDLPGSWPVKKGRHRRFEEARKLKQQGPAAFLPGDRSGPSHDEVVEPEDEYSDLAAKYGAFDDDEDAGDDD